MHDGMQYDPIQGHKHRRDVAYGMVTSWSRALQDWKSGYFQLLYPHLFTMGAGN